jgi:UDP-N-acetylglucosamine 2-epimerase (non-hydrolysing)/GDP/UDP-N,N'-diacetylbacillosamine 2-epimerase (hydrolysing)
VARKICVITGSRAEYGLLRWVMHDLAAAPDVELQVVATGMHLSRAFGMTVDEIERDGFAVARRVDMLLASDTPVGTAKSIGLGVIGMADALDGLRPDLVLVLGDRFEILAAVQACLVLRIPVAHIAGGDTTEGAFDESIRHAITKMSHLHLVTNEQAARRVRQMGEDPARVQVVGSPGLDQLVREPLLDRAALEASLGARLAVRNLLVTFHPVTLSATDSLAEFQALLEALDEFGDDTAVWITHPNADTGGVALTQALQAWAQARPGRVHDFKSLGHKRYLSLMALSDVVVGNSSSGLYEAPSLRVPTVDIGERQRGRLAADSVLNCAASREAIGAAIRRALVLDCSATLNPYGDGHSAARIVQALRALPITPALLQKTFHGEGLS